MENTALNESLDSSHFEPPRNTPAAVQRWYEIHVREGVHRRLAFYRALERAATEGELSESALNRLEGALRDSDGRLNLGGPSVARSST